LLRALRGEQIIYYGGYIPGIEQAYTTTPTTTTTTTTTKTVSYVTQIHEFKGEIQIEPTYSFFEVKTKYLRFVIPNTIQRVASEKRVLKAEVYVTRVNKPFIVNTLVRDVWLNGVGVAGTRGQQDFQGWIDDKDKLSSIFSQPTLEVAVEFACGAQPEVAVYCVKVLVTMQVAQDESSNIINETQYIKSTQQDKYLEDDSSTKSDGGGGGGDGGGNSGGNKNKDQNSWVDALSQILAVLQQFLRPEILIPLLIFILVMRIISAFSR